MAAWKPVGLGSAFTSFTAGVAAAAAVALGVVAVPGVTTTLTVVDVGAAVFGADATAPTSGRRQKWVAGAGVGRADGSGSVCVCFARRALAEDLRDVAAGAASPASSGAAEFDPAGV